VGIRTHAAISDIEKPVKLTQKFSETGAPQVFPCRRFYCNPHSALITVQKPLKTSRLQNLALNQTAVLLALKVTEG
jgi:hypothetical protein